MSKLVCELCGSVNFAKEDGNFVCQDCGCKYSLEEAKKLMSGEVAAPAAAPAKKTSNIRQLAMRAKENGDSETAARYFEQLLLEEPNDWQANFYSIYYAAHNIKIAQIGSAANRVANIIPSTCKMILDQIKEPVDLLDAQLEITTAVIQFSNMLFSNITPNLGSTYEIVNRNIENWACPTVNMLETMGDALTSIFHNNALAQQVYENALGYTTHSKDRVHQAKIQYNSLTAKIASIKDKIRQEERKKKEKEKKEKEARIEKYWKEHPEEKQSLLDEKKEQNEKLDALSTEANVKRRKLNKEMNKPPQQEELDKLQEKINLANADLAGAGFFQFKRKKEIKEQLDALYVERSGIQNEIKEYKEGVKKQLESLEAKLKKDSKPYKDRIAKIDNELTRDR